MAAKFLEFLQTDVRDLFAFDWTEETKAGLELYKSEAELAKVIEENKSKLDWLKTLFEQEQAGFLLAALNSPLAQVLASSVPFVNLAVGAVKFYIEKTKQEPTLEECVLFVSQAAYLDSFRVLANLPENSEGLKTILEAPVSDAVRQQIKALAKLELSGQEARNVVACFHESKLAEAFNLVLAARLQQAGLYEDAAKTFAERVAWNVHRYMGEAWAVSGDALKYLGQPSFTEWQKELAKYQSIDKYLEAIQAKPLETVFAEKFTFKDIYVRLRAKPLNANGEPDKEKPSEILETWAERLLRDGDKQDRVMFVQGGPGRGKSVFCRMFADWVRANLHPIWTPILIRLRDIRTIEKNFEETLRLAVDRDFVKDDSGWLTDRNTRYLFFLDGFDELLMEGRTSGGLEDFLSQVGKFQESCKSNPEKGHRVVITGRTLSLERIDRRLPPNLERVEILPMDEDLQTQWFANWRKVTEPEKAQAFQEFLQDLRCPKRIRGSEDEMGLAQEPLLLYLLAAMHRDREIKIEDFENARGVSAKILIYEKSLDWVLTKQRPEWLNRDLTELEIEGLRRILPEAGLCVVQTGGECAALKTIEARLGSDNNANALLEQARERLGENPLKNALAAFYLQPARDKEKGGSVEFAHKSFGEFLCAERLKESLEDWSKPGDRRKKYYLSNDEMDWEIYDLFGYGGLTQEIAEYLMGLLEKNIEVQDPEKVEKFVRLFDRLEHFYRRWCSGEFIDATPENLPQKKMRLLKDQLKDRDVQLGVRQVDVYAGLNAAILLLELNRYANKDRGDLKGKVAFYPCGRSDSKDFDKSLLLGVIGYSQCIGVAGFVNTVGEFFSGANLRGADLRGANLRGANLENIIFGKDNIQGRETNWEDVRGLEVARDLPEALKQHLGLG